MDTSSFKAFYNLFSINSNSLSDNKSIPFVTLLKIIIFLIKVSQYKKKQLLKNLDKFYDIFVYNIYYVIVWDFLLQK